MDLDDLPIGRVLSRRDALALLGSTGTLLLLGCSRSSAGTARATRTSYPCVVRPAMTEGPYYVDEKLDRSDIRSDPADGKVKEGALLALTFNVSRVAAGACTPLKGAIVDVWHCDALGVYSDAVDPTFNTTGKKFLRGYQVTDAKGTSTFTTIYPGWYPTRAVHIHFKIRSPVSDRSAYEFTSQLFFDEALSDRVYAKPPYAAKGRRTVSNATDRIYKESGGSQLMLNVASTRDGYAATFDVALDHD
ncbi:MAG TPA: intradiol ring-cleavage dioxygenase [Gemmatimonadales bacterium]|jgi:protocatechuate 3,4-dioxygenase beta subunit